VRLWQNAAGQLQAGSMMAVGWISAEKLRIVQNFTANPTR